MLWCTIVSMKTKSVLENTKAHKELRDWLAAEGKSIAQFNRELGYQSNYCFLVLSPTRPRPISDGFLGRLLLVYGRRGPALAVAAAMKGK